MIVALDEDAPLPAITITDVSTDGGATWGAAADAATSRLAYGYGGPTA